MNLSIVVVILISISVLTNAEEEAKEENRDAQDEYSSIELGSPKSSDATEEVISKSERYDGIVDIDDIVRSSEFNNMFYPGTIQVRRFAAPLKDHSSEDLFKDAKLSKNASGEKNRSGKEEKKSAKEMDKSEKKEVKSGKKEEKSGKNDEKSGKNEEKSGKNKEKSGNNEEKSVKNEDKSGMNENKNGVDEGKTGKEKDKSAVQQEENKSAEVMSKSTEENSKTGQEKERRAVEKDKSAIPVEEEKRGGLNIIDIKASRKDDDASSSQEKSDESPKGFSNTADVFDDMDDLIAPYILEKFRKTYEDDNYDKNQYAENKEEPYDDDLVDDGLANLSERPNRRMFGSSPIPDFDKEKAQIAKPSFDSFSTPKPFFGNVMPPPQLFKPMMRPPIPYVNNMNRLPNTNIRLPPQFNNFQKPFPRQNFNNLFGKIRDSTNDAPDFNAYNNNYNDINEYPYTPPSETSRSGRAPTNPIFKKLARASNNPRPIPVYFNFKYPIRPLTTPHNIRPRLNIPPNYNPYLFRYKRSLRQMT